MVNGLGNPDCFPGWLPLPNLNDVEFELHVDAAPRTCTSDFVVGLGFCGSFLWWTAPLQLHLLVLTRQASDPDLPAVGLLHRRALSKELVTRLCN